MLDRRMEICQHPPTETCKFCTDFDLLTALDLLKTKRRYELIKSIDEREGVVGVSDLADELKHLGHDADNPRKVVYISFIQVHLPKLDDFDVVQYNHERKTVEKGEHFNKMVNIQEAVERVLNEDTGWTSKFRTKWSWRE